MDKLCIYIINNQQLRTPPKLSFDPFAALSSLRHKSGIRGAHRPTSLGHGPLIDMDETHPPPPPRECTIEGLLLLPSSLLLTPHIHACEFYFSTVLFIALFITLRKLITFSLKDLV